MVSAEGLIFTNHHCGYGTIASASTMEHNYLKDGFYARNKGEEIPGKIFISSVFVAYRGCYKGSVRFMKGLSGAERASRQSAVLASINSRLSDGGKNIETRISPLFKGNQFLAFVYQRFKDVRLVGTPPESMVSLVAIQITGSGHAIPGILRFSGFMLPMGSQPNITPAIHL
jgi:hypothetical protein